MSNHCSICGSENPDGELICLRCGVALVRTGFVLDGDFDIRLYGDDRASVHIQSPQSEGYILGRTDDASDYLPDIDLALFGGREYGVSRRHAALVRYRGRIHILDLNSVNGTYLNGRRLIPDTPYPLSVGDALKLGNMNLVISHTDK